MICRIAYTAFTPAGAECEFELPDCFMDGDALAIAEQIFRATNLYEGPVWDRLSPYLPAKRTHTAVSVGDILTIGDTVLKCDSFGWKVWQEDAQVFA